MTFHPDQLPDLTGKTYVVTGGNSGIGFHTVSHLAAHGAHVYLCARSSTKGTAAIEHIKSTQANALVSLLLIDHTSFGSVTSAANHVLTHAPTLHGLINNAGIMATPFSITADGHEAQWQTNYLSHWLLTTLLLPLLLRTARSLPEGSARGSVRIVSVSSSGHLGAPRDGIHFADPSLPDGSPDGGVWPRYGQSKLANILHTKTLHRTYGPGSPPSSSSSSRVSSGEGEIWTTSVHPGIVETNLAAPATAAGGVFARLIPVIRALGLVYPADKGAGTSLWCAAGADVRAEQSGGYFEVHGRCGEPWWESRLAKSEELAERLDKWTRNLMRREGWVE